MFFAAGKKEEPESEKKKVFVCFDINNDESLLDELVNHAKSCECRYEIGDWSSEPWDRDIWKEGFLTKIKKCSAVIVLVGEKTRGCSNVKDEIELARRANVPVIGIRGYKDKVCQQPEGLQDYREDWTWDTVNEMVEKAGKP